MSYTGQTHEEAVVRAFILKDGKSALYCFSPTLAVGYTRRSLIVTI